MTRALKMHANKHLFHGLEGKERLGTALKSVASLVQSGGGKKQNLITAEGCTGC